MNRILVAVAMLALMACTQDSSEESAPQYFATANGPVEFEFPSGWYKNEERHPFDLQCFSEYERMNTGVFLFAAEDLAEDLSPREVLQRQIDDMSSKRENFRILEEEQVIQREGQTLTTVVFSGEKDSSRSFYKFTLIEFTESPELIPVLLQVSTPSYWNEHKPVLEGIAASGRVRKQGAQDNG